MTTAHGLRVACLGGVYDGNLYTASQEVHVCLIILRWELD